MSNKIVAARWELVLFGAALFILGSVFHSCMQTPSKASMMGEDTPGITVSANRMACALEGIQHVLERLEKSRR